MQQLRFALVVAVLAVTTLGSTAAVADGHAETPATKPAKRGIPTKTPLPAMKATKSSKPSLAQLVALGKDEAPAPIAAHEEHAAPVGHAAPVEHAAPAEHADEHTAPADHAAPAAPAEHVDAHEAKAEVPAFPTSTSALPAGLTTGQPAPSTMPWGAFAFFVALIGGAVAVWWKKKQGVKASGSPLLTVKESTSIGPRRQLLVVDVAGRRVLLSSSEAGVTMLLDCGQSPSDAGSHDDAGAERFFGDALVKAVRQERQEPTGLQLVNTAGQPLPAPPAFSMPPTTSSSSMPQVASVSGPVRKNEAEATELMRRLGR